MGQCHRPPDGFALPQGGFRLTESAVGTNVAAATAVFVGPLAENGVVQMALIVIGQIGDNGFARHNSSSFPTPVG